MSPQRVLVGKIRGVTDKKLCPVSSTRAGWVHASHPRASLSVGTVQVKAMLSGYKHCRYGQVQAYQG